MNPQIIIKPFEAQYAEGVTALWRESMSEAIGIDPVHSFESQLYFLTEILPQNYELFVASDKGTASPVALLVCSLAEINQLYVDRRYQGQGVGSALLKIAMERSAGTLRLRTFEVNHKAQRFYEGFGFVAIGGDSNNEEGLPDILYEWRRAE